MDIRPGQQRAGRGLVVKKSKDDLNMEDIMALVPLINKAWEAAGVIGETHDDFAYRFLGDIFAAGWTSQSTAPDNPKEPSSRDESSCSVRMGHLIRDSDGTVKNPESQPYRQAGAEVRCKVSEDDTRLMFVYVDKEGAHVKYEQKNPDGSQYINIRLSDTIEAIHACAVVAWDAAESSRYGFFNRTNFLNEARTSLHHWYHVSLPYEIVPHLNFEPQHATSWVTYLSKLNEALLSLQHNANPS